VTVFTYAVGLPAINVWFSSLFLDFHFSSCA